MCVLYLLFEAEFANTATAPLSWILASCTHFRRLFSTQPGPCGHLCSPLFLSCSGASRAEGVGQSWLLPLQQAAGPKIWVRWFMDDKIPSHTKLKQILPGSGHTGAWRAGFYWDVQINGSSVDWGGAGSSDLQTSLLPSVPLLQGTACSLRMWGELC